MLFTLSLAAVVLGGRVLSAAPSVEESQVAETQRPEQNR